MAWGVGSEPLVVPTRLALPVAPYTGHQRAGAVGGWSHGEERRKASLCFPTTGGPRSLCCLYNDIAQAHEISMGYPKDSIIKTITNSVIKFY